MKPTPGRHVGPVLAVVVLEIATVLVVWLLAGLAAAGYCFPWVLAATLWLADWPHTGDLWPVLVLLQFALYAVVAGLAFGGNRTCRWLLLALLVVQVAGVFFCSPWKMARAF